VSILRDSVIKHAVEKYGSPLYIFDTDAFKNQFEYLKRTLGKDVKVNYCMKTNPFLTEYSVPYTDRIEVCSFGEFLICKERKIDPKKLLISGVLKKEEDVETIVSYCTDKAIYTAESENQIHVLNKVAGEHRIVINVYLRLNAGQFGIDEEAILNNLKKIDEFKNIHFYGIHYFTGTQKHKLQKHEKELTIVKNLCNRIKNEIGIKVENLEYGTGFGVPYFEGQEETLTAYESLNEFKELLYKMDFDLNISLEMGRALAYNCGYYCVLVRDIKQSDGVNYCITDGGIHQINYDGQLRGMYHPIIRIIGNDEEKDEKKYVLCGSLCTTNDILTIDYPIRGLKDKNIIVFERAGAYSLYEGMSLFLSHELPGVAFYNMEDGLTLARKQEESFKINTAFSNVSI